MYLLVFLFLCIALAYIWIEENDGNDAKHLMEYVYSNFNFTIYTNDKRYKDFLD